MIEHIESFLGKIESAWDAPESNSNIQIIKFSNQPFKNINTYSTLGLSNSILDLTPRKQVRQELIISANQTFSGKEIASSLLTFSEHVLETKKALLRGEVIGPGEPFINGVKTTGVYASVPVFFEEDFQVYDDKTNPPVVFVWLIPVLTDEITFIKKKGWSKFEDLLEKNECDFWNLNRESIV